MSPGAKSLSLLAVVALVGLNPSAVRAARPGEVPETFVRDVAAVERVLYEHRTWPAENGGTKPSFEATVPPDRTRSRAERALRMAQALDQVWHRPLSADQLEQEVARIFAGSRDRETLEEIVRAVEGDPQRFALAVAMPLLVERLARSWQRDGKTLAGEADQAFDRWWEENAPGLDPLSSEGWPMVSPRVLTRARAATEGCAGACAGGWQTTPLGARPDARTQHTAVWTGTEMIVWGGLDSDLGAGEYYLAHGSRYTPATDSWTATTAWGAPSPRHSHTAVWTGSLMIIWGGEDAEGKFATGGMYNPALDLWTPTSTASPCPGARIGHTAVWTGSRMILWGGTLTGGTTTSTGGRFDPVANTWAATSTGTGCPTPRGRHTAVWTGSRMLVWGGWLTNTGGAYDPAANQWTALPTGASCPAARADHTAVWTGSDMIVWGGYDGSDNHYYTGGRYNPQSGTWTPTSTLAGCPAPRTAHTAVWTGSEMIIWGGLDAIPKSTGSCYNPTTDTWRKTPSTGACPARRAQHTAVWTGTEMIVWGGTLIDDPATDTGGRFLPVSNSWVPTSLGVGLRSVSQGQSLVWTGAEVIAWGGYSDAIGTGYFSSGIRYVPALGSVLPTPTAAPCPSPRQGHAGVWSGTEMLLWGGEDPFRQALGDGARYSPADDSWTVLSTASPCPTARVSPSCVWTGNCMVIWGGTASVGDSAIGGRYDPGDDSWKGVTSAGAPPGRAGYATVWTGSRMVVWGGGQMTNVGGVYDPGSDTWSSTSTGANCPAGRYNHAAAWTGSRMLVWGGKTAPSYDPSSYSRTGALYDPASDTWAPTSLLGACPTARERHTAVSTTAGIIVWGGDACVGSYGNTTYFGDGALYEASTDSWTALAQSAACPSPRALHSAVSLGTKMVISGGSPQTVVGGLYDTSASSPTRPTISGPLEGCPPLQLETQSYACYQWFLGGAPISGAVDRSLVITASGSYTVTGWDANGCSATSLPVTVEIWPLPTATITVGASNTCPTTTVPLDAQGVFASCQWYYGSRRVDGATSSHYDASLAGDYHVRVSGSDGCSGESASSPVSGGFCRQTETSPPRCVFPLRLVRDIASATGYYLYFQKTWGATGYNIYQGTVGTWYNHGSNKVCNATVHDLGTGEMRAVVTPLPADSYFLVTAYTLNEGTCGFATSGAEIPRTQSTCPPVG